MPVKIFSFSIFNIKNGCILTLVSLYSVAASLITSKFLEHNTENEEFEKSHVLQKWTLMHITLTIIIKIFFWLRGTKPGITKKLIFRVLEINWLDASDTPFSSSKTTCNISTTSCWVLKSKGTCVKFNSLRFKAPKKLDGSTGLFELFLLPCSDWWLVT